MKWARASLSLPWRKQLRHPGEDECVGQVEQCPLVPGSLLQPARQCVKDLVVAERAGGPAGGPRPGEHVRGVQRGALQYGDGTMEERRGGLVAPEEKRRGGIEKEIPNSHCRPGR